jgi:DNA-binding NarL/FixJ family response regulator
VRDGQSVVSVAQQLQPDLVLMEIALPVLDGLQAGQQLRKRQPKVKLLYVSMHGDRLYVEAALRIGASGYVLKQSGWEELSHAIEAVLAGQQYVSAELSTAMRHPPILPLVMPDASLRSVTLRQRQILKLVVAGYTAKEIGRLLHITPKTVESHKGQLMRQLHLHSTVELACYALTHGLA